MLPVSLRIWRFIHSCTSLAGISLVYGCQLSEAMKLTGGYGLRSSSLAMGYSVPFYWLFGLLFRYWRELHALHIGRSEVQPLAVWSPAAQSR
jgi:hypothetical protein